MKLIYCHCNICNPGGMERVMVNKITYLVNRLHWEVVIVTTDQKDRPSFYRLPQGVRVIDLGVNYTDDNGLRPLKKIVGYLKRRKVHRKRLTEVLIQEKADIVVSLFPSESSFIPSIKDGSKKVLELHFNKFFRLQYNRKGLLGMIDRIRTRMDEWLVRKFDKFVVLTHEDKSYWGALPNIEVIPNAALSMDGCLSEVNEKRVIAVGRLDYQKGFDRLIEAWKRVMQVEAFKDWRLDIFGQGEWQEMLQQMIDRYELQHSICIHIPTKKIGAEYAESSMLVMSSHYEGFPMVMIEAMACGLPVVCFDFLCGPKDIIRSGENGLLVENGDIEKLAVAMMKVMGNEELRRKMSVEARKVTDTYSEEKVMKQWVSLFEGLA